MRLSLASLLAIAGLAIALPQRAAATDGEVLILSTTTIGGLTSVEAQAASAQGLKPVLVDPATWSRMTTAEFASYRAIILGDPDASAAALAAAEANVATWAPAVSGNVLLLGTDPVGHLGQGGDALTRRGVEYAVAQPGKTGLYFALSQDYDGVPSGSTVPILEGLRPGGFTVDGQVNCYNNAHIVATHPAISSLTDATLSNWGCSVHSGFVTWPGDFSVLAIARDLTNVFTASDGTQGLPYILASGEGLRSFPLSVTPTRQDLRSGATAKLTAELLDAATRLPVGGVDLGFTVESGPNKGAKGFCLLGCLTGDDGLAVFTYVGRGPGSDVVRVFVDRNLNRIADVGEPQTTALVSWSKPPMRYVALGDSYSSGEGAYGYASETDKAGANECHRSDNAYGPVLARRWGVGAADFRFGACSGAIMAHLTESLGGPGQWNEGPQLDSIAPFDSPDPNVGVVTLSIGGNDLGFAEALTDCISGFGQDVSAVQCQRTIERGLSAGTSLIRDGGLIRIDTTDSSWIFCGIDAPRCSNRKPYVSRDISDLAGMLGKIRDRAPNARIVVVLYPHLFAEKLPSSCVVGRLPQSSRVEYRIPKSIAERMNQVGDDLDRVIADEVRQARGRGIDAVTVETRDAFAKREVPCLGFTASPADSYLNGLVIAGRLPSPQPESFHPNGSGQSAFADLVALVADPIVFAP